MMERIRCAAIYILFVFSVAVIAFFAGIHYTIMNQEVSIGIEPDTAYIDVLGSRHIYDIEGVN